MDAYASGAMWDSRVGGLAIPSGIVALATAHHQPGIIMSAPAKRCIVQEDVWRSSDISGITSSGITFLSFLDYGRWGMVMPDAPSRERCRLMPEKMCYGGPFLLVKRYFRTAIIPFGKEHIFF